MIVFLCPQVPAKPTKPGAFVNMGVGFSEFMSTQTVGLGREIFGTTWRTAAAMLIMVALKGSAQTSATLPLPFRMGFGYSKDQVVAAEWVPMLAVSRRIFNWVQFAMRFAGNKLEVIRIAAGSISTSVMEFFAFRNQAEKKLVEDGMNSLAFHVDRHPSVSVHDRSGPDPASGGIEENASVHTLIYQRRGGVSI